MRQLIHVFILVAFSSCNMPWQESNTKNYQNLPSLNVLALDSSTVLNTKDLRKNRPIIIFYFSPDCEHCEAETVDLLSNMQFLTNAQIFFLSPAVVGDIVKFSHIFHLERYANITIASDYQYQFYNEYKVRSFPLIVIYDRFGKLTKIYKGELEISSIARALKD
jgi:peroxiredoxin